MELIKDYLEQKGLSKKLFNITCKELEAGLENFDVKASKEAIANIGLRMYEMSDAACREGIKVGKRQGFKHGVIVGGVVVAATVFTAVYIEAKKDKKSKKETEA